MSDKIPVTDPVAQRLLHDLRRTLGQSNDGVRYARLPAPGTPAFRRLTERIAAKIKHDRGNEAVAIAAAYTAAVTLTALYEITEE
jgi:hypothetical protein